MVRWILGGRVDAQKQMFSGMKTINNHTRPCLLKWFFFGLCLLALTGCGTKAVSLEKASPTPSSRLLAFQNADHPGNSRVTVIRDKGFGKAGCYFEIYLNETMAARIDKSEKATFYLAPGPLLLAVGPDLKGPILCGYDPGNSKQIKTTLRSNEEKVFRISFSAGGKIHLSREKTNP